MLIQFRVKNFRSFKDEQVLSLTASADKNLPDNTISTPALKKMRLLKSAVMYGANASGKSNLVSAIDFVKNFVTKSTERRPDSLIPIHTFQLDTKSKSSPAEFELIFVHEGVRYEYGFSVNNKRVHDEWLIAYPKGAAQTWFERPSQSDATEADWYFGRHLKGEKSKLIPLTRPDVLFLSIAAQFNHPQLSTIYEWFSKRLYIVVDEMPSQILELMTLESIKENEDLHFKVKNLLKIADLGIVDFTIEEKARARPSIEDLPQDAPEELGKLLNVLNELTERLGNREELSVTMQHQIMAGDTAGVRFEFHDESLGTRRLFGLSGLIFSVLQTGATLVVDELDSSLHPVLARELITMFQNPQTNQTGAQLIFNTHDTTLLDLTLFRRDQIWFIEKDNRGESHLYSLLEFKPRKTEAISKGYLQGRYGAIPFLSNIGEFLADGA